MTKVFPQSLGVIAAVIFIASVGCSNEVPLGTVSGTVTLDGQPYSNAHVEFAPEEGRPSSAITDDQGQYELRFSPDAKGALIGKHTVRITTVQQSTSDRGKDPKFKEKIPAKYHARSELAVEVGSGKNNHDFTLTTK